MVVGFYGSPFGFVFKIMFKLLNVFIAVFAGEIWRMKIRKFLELKEIYIDCTPLGMITMKTILGTGIPRNKCNIYYQSTHIFDVIPSSYVVI